MKETTNQGANEMNLTFKKQAPGHYRAISPEGWEIEVAKYHAPSSETAVYGTNAEAINYCWGWNIWGAPSTTSRQSPDGCYNRTMSECKEDAQMFYEDVVAELAAREA